VSSGKPYSGPSKNKVDNLNIKGHGAQQEKKFINATGQNQMLPVANGYYYQTGIVLDFIENPKFYFNNNANRVRIDSYLTEDDRSFNFLEKIPKNSIVCQIIDRGVNEYKKPTICFPFFPSHICLPIKPGEHAWIMSEVTGDVERHYWVARKHAAFHVENLNYTHQERELNIYRDSRFIKNAGNLQQASVSSFRYLDFPQIAKSGTESLDPFDIHQSMGFSDLTVEPVPEIAKKPGDLLLQGSNNASVHLTQEKFTVPNSKIQETYPLNTFSGADLTQNLSRIPFSPAIDICVARKKNELLELKETIAKNEGADDFIKTESGLGFIRNFSPAVDTASYEVNKFAFVTEDEKAREINSIALDYDTNIYNCGARVYLSNNCDIDNVFNIGLVKPKEGEQSAQENFERADPGAVFAGYADNIRFVSDGTFRVVNNFTVKESGKEKTGSTYIEIAKDGKVSIGSIDKNFPSEGGESEDDSGNTNNGMQPFVKGHELQVLLERLINEIQGIAEILNGGFSFEDGANATAGFGMPNLGLGYAALELFTIPTGLGEAPYNNLETIKKDLIKFKSTLIQGE